MLYNPPTGSSDADASYVGKTVSSQGSKVPRMAVEAPQREIVSVIEGAGLAPTNSDLQQLLRAIRSGHLFYQVDAGAQNAIQIAPDPAHTTLNEGDRFRIVALYDNTGPVTVRVNTITPQPLVRSNGSPLRARDIMADQPFDIVYRTGQFRLLNFSPAAVKSADRKVQQYVAPGTYTFIVPVGVYTVTARVYGAGGGGGGCVPGNNAAGGGGGGGYQEDVFAVVPGTAYTVIVGAPGSGALGTGQNNGGTGGTSSFSNLLSATGGQGGYGAAASAVAAGGVGGTGSGSGGNSAISAGGGSGGGGQNLGSWWLGGSGGPVPYGASITVGTVGQGSTGFGPGGGGTGGANGGGGGNGGGGAVIIEME